MFGLKMFIAQQGFFLTYLRPILKTWWSLWKWEEDVDGCFLIIPMLLRFMLENRVRWVWLRSLHIFSSFFAFLLFYLARLVQCKCHCGIWKLQREFQLSLLQRIIRRWLYPARKQSSIWSSTRRRWQGRIS